MSYGIIVWGNSSHSSIIFKIEIKVIRIMEGCGNRVSCRNLFKHHHHHHHVPEELGVFPVP